MTTKIGFIGAGNMASALAGGLIADGYKPELITLSDINEDQLKAVEASLNIKTCTDNDQLITNNDVIVLAVKPQVMQQVLQPLAKSISEKKPLLVSIAAGITVTAINQWLGSEAAIVRCMPNTPALVQKGASGLFASKEVNDKQKQLAEQILATAGIVKWLTQESDIDAVTALSGSGPAYYFLMMEAMIKAGMKLGLSEANAKALTLQTAAGAAEMAIQSEFDIEELRRKVTSPGGTTEAAIKSFESKQFVDIVDKAMDAAYKRSVELASS